MPDLDRTDHLVIIGANPLVSNGSLATAADFPGKLRALRRRGGRLVVIDPRRTRTAELADRHVAIRPGTDARCCSPSCTCCSTRTSSTLGGIAEHVTGVDEVARAGRGLRAGGRRRALRRARRRDPRARPRARGRADGARCTAGSAPRTVEFGTLGQLAGRRRQRPDRQPRPARRGDVPARPDGRRRRARRPGPRLHDRPLAQPGLRATPRRKAELPVAALAEEIDTPGDGQIRALITIAGNPVLSAPDGDRLDRGARRASTSWSASTRTSTRPPGTPTSSCRRRRPSQSAHFDFAFNNLAVRNNARYSPPVLPLRRPARRGARSWRASP